MTIGSLRFLLALVLLTVGPMARGQEGAGTVVLSPFQVFASSLEMSAHYSIRQGKKTLEFIRVKHVAPGSMADRAGLKKGDRIVAISGWRLEGQELTALNRDFPTKLQDGVPVLTVTVRHSSRDEEREITLRYPPKKRNGKEPNQTPESPPSPAQEKAAISPQAERGL